MPRAKRKRDPAGRPVITIDWAEADRLLVAGCTGAQVAAYFGMHPNTFYERTQMEKGINFSDYRATKVAHGDALITSKQFDDALGLSKMKGNVQLLLRLGELRLGQRNESTDASQGRAFVSLFQKLEKIESALHRRGIKLSDLEAEQSLLDQGPGRQEDTIPSELGAEGAI